MGKITAYNQNNFKSTSQLFAKIKRELKSFNAVNLLDESDFHQYVSEILQRLGIGTYKEDEVILVVKNKKAVLPKDFKQLYAAYKCCNDNNNGNDLHYQGKTIYENDITCEIIGKKSNCEIHCECNEKVIERVTVKQYVKDNKYNNKTYSKVSLLKLSPNIKESCSEDCLNLLTSCNDEITINNGMIYTNFCDGDILLKYYAFPVDDEGYPEIPDILEVEKACEWYIKYSLVLNMWLVDDLKDSVNKWQKAEVEYEKWMAEARFKLKLPSFTQMVNTIRNKKGMNLHSYFSQQGFRRY